MTVNFVDLMIIDQDTSAFLLDDHAVACAGRLRSRAIATAALLTGADWRLDPFRVRRRFSVAGGLVLLRRDSSALSTGVPDRSP